MISTACRSGDARRWIGGRSSRRARVTGVVAAVILSVYCATCGAGDATGAADGAADRLGIGFAA